MADILLVDDDPHLREVLRYSLVKAGHAVREAVNGRAALEEVARQVPQLVVLDVMMPELDGLEVCRRIRQSSSVPVLFLSSRDEELDKVLGLEMGGDDYMTKPFSPRELVSRVKAILRRSEGASPDEPAEVLKNGRITLDASQHKVWVDGVDIPFTVTEFNMLRALMRRPGRAFTRDEMVERSYEGRHFVAERTLDSHVRRIRAKLREHGEDPIETVHGLGYRFRGS